MASRCTKRPNLALVFLNKSSAVDEMGDRLATLDMGRKVGAVQRCCAPFGEGSWVPIKHDMAKAEAYLRTKWYLDPPYRLATIHHRHRQTEQTYL